MLELCAAIEQAKQETQRSLAEVQVRQRGSTEQREQREDREQREETD